MLGFYFRHGSVIVGSVVLLALSTTAASAYPDLTWTGTGVDGSWATSQNWNPLTPPTVLDSVFFTDAGAAKAPGVVTNFLPADQSVANLSYANDGTNHTTDLQGHTLDVSGILQINTNQNGGTQTTISNGTLQIGSELTPGNLYVARQLQSVNNSIFATLDLSSTTFNATLNTLVIGQKSQGMEGGGLGVLLGGSSGDIQVGSVGALGTVWLGRTFLSGTSTGLVDFSNQTSFTAHVGDFWLGTADGGAARGTMYLSPDNVIQANSIRIGYSSQSENFNGTSVLRLGASNVIGANEFIVGGRKSLGSVEIVPGGSLTLGTAEAPTALLLAQNDQATNFEQIATMNLQGATFNAHLSQLVLADKSAGNNGGATATFVGGNQGAIVVGSESQLGNIIVGRNTQGASAFGQLDLGGQTNLTADVDQFLIGVATNSPARGVAVLAQTNEIRANAIIVGRSLTADNYNQPSTLSLGMQNDIVAGQLLVGGRRSDGTLDTPVGAVVNLGSIASPTSFIVGRNDANTGGNQNANASFASATFNAHLSELIVGQKSGGSSGSTNSSLIGGSQGDIVVGTAASPGNIYVGHNIDGSFARATADLGGQDSLTATLHQLLVGYAHNGTARSTLILPHTNTIDADEIVVGHSLTGDNYLAGIPSILRLGMQNDITANQVLVGGRRSAGLLEIAAGGVLNLGTDLKPASFIVGRNDADTGANPNQTATANLAGSTFNAHLSELIVGEKSAGPNGSTISSLVGGSHGDLVVGSQAVPGNIYVGHNIDGSFANATADLGGQDSLTATLHQLLVGYAHNGTARATLILPHTNTIDADEIVVGHSLTGDNYHAGIPSILRFGAQNDITANQVVIGGRRSGGSLEIVAGGVLNLGTELKPTSFVVGRNDADTGANPNQTATANLAGSTFNAHLSELIVGEKSAGPNGSTISSLVGGSQGDLVIGSEASPGNIYVGRNLSGSSATGQLDLGGQDTLTANLDRLQIGYTESGSARGNVTLPKSNEIHANQILVGYSTVNANGQINTLALGVSNVITANEFTVGGNLSNGNLTILPGGSLALGNSTDRTALAVGQTNTFTGSSFSSSMNLTGATFDAFLSHLAVGDKTLASGSVTGTLLGATGGNVDIGTPASLGNLFIGRSLGGGTAQGTVDFSGLSSFSADLAQLVIGSNGTGLLTLPNTSAIDAQTMVVGANGAATLLFGSNTTLLVDDFQIGNSYSNAVVDIQNANSLQLGAADRRTNLAIANVATNTNSTFGATVDFSGASVTGYLSNLTVGYKDNGLAGATKASLLGGSAGSINIEGVGGKANMVVGVGTNAIVDFSGLDDFDATLDQMLLGGPGGSATVSLAAHNHVDATTVTVGSNGNATLNLGVDNTFLVDELKVGMHFGSGAVLMPSGGVLTIGSLARPTNLTLGSGLTNTNNIYSGTLDATNATLHAHLGHVIIGQKDNLPGKQQGLLTISTHADNTIVADSIFMGGTNAEGRINFGGGSLSAHSISRGDGTAVFNWTGGTLQVDSFGTPARPMDLNNTNFGTLAAGYSSGVTQVFGNYLQGAVATFEVEEQLGQFDRAVISKNATLDGTLSLVLTPGFSPNVGESFLILSATAVGGVFAEVDGYYAGGDTFLYPVYHPTFVELRAYLAGDSNFDGAVDGADYTNWANNFLQSAGGVAAGDFNGDGLVDAGDYTLWANHYTGGGAFAASAVPEPSTLLLGTSGLIALLAYTTRRRRAEPI